MFDEPVVRHCLGFILVSDVVASKIIRDDFLGFALHRLSCESERWRAVLVRGFEEIAKPGEEAHS